MPRDIDPPLQDLRKQWLADALRPYGDDPALLAYFEKALKRNHSNSRGTFSRWFQLKRANYPNAASLPKIDPTEISTPAKVLFETNGDTLLVLVGEHQGRPVIWKLPAGEKSKAFVRSVLPVRVKQLKPLESPERKQVRKMRAELKRERFYMPAAWQTAFADGISKLETQAQRADRTRPPRYSLYKMIAGFEVPVHSLYLDFPNVGCVDGDFLNFGTTKVTTKTQRTDNAVGLIPTWDEYLPSETVEEWIPNLFREGMVDDPNYHLYQERQAEYDKSMPQVPRWKELGYQEKVLPNADLGRRAGFYGEVTDCGVFEPLHVGEGQNDLLDHSMPETRLKRDSVLSISARAAQLARAWGVKSR